MRVGKLSGSAPSHYAVLLLGGLLAASVTVRAERLPVKTYTTADGLPSTFIQRIIRDSHGFLWFCTRDGLARFDGHRFVNYTMEHGLSHPTINHLLETRGGVYWVATNGGGVCRFNPKAAGAGGGREAQNSAGRANKSLFSTYPVGDELITNRVNVLYEDRAGRLWAGTDGGLFRLEESGGQFRPIKLGLPRHLETIPGVTTLAEDREGSLWVGTSRGLVRRLPDGREAYYAVNPSRTGDVVSAMLKDRGGRLWIGHLTGLILLQPKPAAETANESAEIGAAGLVRWYTSADGLPHNYVTALHESPDGRIQVGTFGGLTVFDGARFRSYTTAQGITERVIQCLAEDRDGNLWIGTETTGTMKLARSGLTAYGEADGSGLSRIYSISETAAGEVLAIDRYWRISYFKEGRLTSARPLLPLNTEAAWMAQTMFLDHTGQHWALTDAGLYRFPPVSRVEQLARTRPVAVYTSRNGLTGDNIYRVFEDSRGDLWIGIFQSRQGLTRWERATESFHQYSEADGLPPFNTPSAFCEDRAGSLWIGFKDGGLVRYSAGRFTPLPVSDGWPRGLITAIHQDQAGRLWIAGSHAGLTRVDDQAAERPRFVRYTTAEGLSSNNVRCLTEDRWGRIYAGTVRGVDRLEPETGRVKHYTTAEGLSNNFVITARRDRQGKIWFGTMKGLSRLIPELDRPEPPPPIWIGGLRVRGETQTVSELGESELSGLVLGPGENQVQIDFFSLGFASGEAIRYQYKLEGADRDWSAPTEERSVNYASLSPGGYRFLVRAVGGDGTPSPTPAVVAFRILPPVWQRWWFITLAAISVALLTYALYRHRLRRLIELERVRTRIATDLHDDIGSSLSRMAILSEVVKQQVGVTHNQSLEKLSEIAETARGLVDSMSDIVWSIDPRRDDLRNVIMRVRQFASDMLEARGIKWDLQTPPDLEQVKLSPEQRRHLFLIFKEAITNSARHSDCASVSLSLSVAGNQFLAEIRDDGRGFAGARPEQPPANGRGGHGLENMQTRAAQLGGRLSIFSSPGGGTSLALTVPLK